MARFLSVFKRLLKRGYPELDRAVKEYARKKGLKVEDVLAAAVAAYLSADDEGREELEAAVREMKAKRGMAPDQAMKMAMTMFKEMMDITVDAMVKVHEAGQRLVRASLINEIRGTMETVKEIQRMGQEGGRMSIDDIIAEAVLTSMLARLGAPMRKKGRRRTGSAPVEELPEGFEGA